MKLIHLLMLLGLAAIAVLSGCGTRSQIKEATALAEKEGYLKASQECLELQTKYARAVTSLQADLKEKNERLRKFNQLNPDGSLKKANPCYDNPNDLKCQEKVTGRESWQK